MGPHPRTADTPSYHGSHPARPAHRRVTGRTPHGRHIVVSRAASRTAGASSCHGPHSARPAHCRVTGRTPRSAHRRVTGRIPARPVHRRVTGRTPHGLTGQTAPKGSHYSVAVGERSEPAEGGPPIIIGPKGVEHTVHAGRSAGGAEQPYALSWMFGPLGPQVASCRRAAQAAWAAPRSGIGFHHVIMARLALRVGFIFWKNRGGTRHMAVPPRV